ncbi:hypothetical protein V8C44DRAFT_318160 [Trichoderma aethiopicum]
MYMAPTTLAIMVLVLLGVISKTNDSLWTRRRIPASRPSVRSNSSRDIPRPSPPQQDSSPFARRLASLAAGMREGRLSRCSAY